MIKAIKEKTKKILRPLDEPKVSNALKDGTTLYDAMTGGFHFKRNFIQFIKNNKGDACNFTNVGNYRQCSLGKWIYGEGEKLCGGIEEWQYLSKVHREAHRCAVEVLKLHNEGNSKQAQHILLCNYIPISNDVQKTATKLYKIILNEEDENNKKLRL